MAKKKELKPGQVLSSHPSAAPLSLCDLGKMTLLLDPSSFNCTRGEILVPKVEDCNRLFLENVFFFLSKYIIVGGGIISSLNSLPHPQI